MKLTREIINILPKNYFERMDLSNSIIEKNYFSNFNFSECNFSYSIFVDCYFYDCIFDKSVLNNINLKGTIIKGCQFKDCNLKNLNSGKHSWFLILIEEGRSQNVVFENCDLSGANFVESVSDINFINSTINKRTRGISQKLIKKYNVKLI